jgi:hypothetical protein
MWERDGLGRWSLSAQVGRLLTHITGAIDECWSGPALITACLVPCSPVSLPACLCRVGAANLHLACWFLRPHAKPGSCRGSSIRTTHGSTAHIPQSYSPSPRCWCGRAPRRVLVRLQHESHAPHRLGPHVSRGLGGARRHVIVQARRDLRAPARSVHRTDSPALGCARLAPGHGSHAPGQVVAR